MLPAFLITFREIIEAALIVATILGILYKLKQRHLIKTVWIATGCATLVSIILLVLGSLLGLKVQELYSAKEEIIEGGLMILSAVFITWAVFFLHKYFAGYKTRLLSKIKKTVEKEEQRGLFALVFTAVFREGIEVVLFLSTVYFSSNPVSIITGSFLGFCMAMVVALGLFSATIKLPLYKTFKLTSLLLIFFAAGLLGRGVHEFTEIRLIPDIGQLTFTFLPDTSTFGGGVMKSIFGLTHKMDLLQIYLYGSYTLFMSYYVFGKKTKTQS